MVRKDVLVLILSVGMWIMSAISPFTVKAVEETETAELLIALLKAGCTVVAEQQSLINDPSKGMKGFTGESVGTAIAEKFKADTHIDLSHASSTSQGNLLRAMLQSEREVVADMQPVINKQGIGFKGFVPFVFAQKTEQRFFAKTGIRMKFTRADYQVSGSEPDGFEAEVLRMFADPHHPKGLRYSRVTSFNGKQALRVMYPEYVDAAYPVCPEDVRSRQAVTGRDNQIGDRAGLTCAISVVLPIHSEQSVNHHQRERKRS